MTISSKCKFESPITQKATVRVCVFKENDQYTALPLFIPVYSTI